MFKNVIFDWSGVINDNTYACYQSVMAVFRFLNTPEISFEEFRKEWRQPYMDFYHQYIPGIVHDESMENVYIENILKYDKNQPFPGIVKLIKKLNKNNLTLFIITSDPSQVIGNQILLFNLENIFKKIISESHDKTIDLKNLVKDYHLNLSETIFLGDSNHEIEAGKKVGVKTGAITWGYCLEEKLKSYNPDYVFHNLKELENILLK